MAVKKKPLIFSEFLEIKFTNQGARASVLFFFHVKEGIFFRLLLSEIGLF